MDNLVTQEMSQKEFEEELEYRKDLLEDLDKREQEMERQKLEILKANEEFNLKRKKKIQKEVAREAQDVIKNKQKDEAVKIREEGRRGENPAPRARPETHFGVSKTECY